MEKIKHNKRTNTGLIFEFLVQQITTNTVSRNDVAAKKALYLIRKYFRPGTQILEELKLFNSILFSEVEKWQVASRLLSEVVEASKKLDINKLNEEKFKLVTEIGANFDRERFFNSRVSNYQTYSSLWALINSARNSSTQYDVAEKVKLEENVIQHLLDNTEVKRINEFKNIAHPEIGNDSLAFFFVIKKFNQKYDKVLTEAQKEILREYIQLSSERQFNEYAKKVAKRIEGSLYQQIKKSKDRGLSTKIFEAMRKLTEIDKYSKEKKTEVLMTYSQLVEELNKLNEQK